MRLRTAALAAIFFGILPSTSIAGDGCANCFWQSPILAEVELSFERTFTGTYRPGEPHDVLTINPAGTGDTFDSAGIRLRIRLTCEFGKIPVIAEADDIMLYNGNLAVGTFLTASMPTDSEGWTEFHGTMRGGGCAQNLNLFLDGCGVTNIPIKINSPDTGSASPCAVDAGDLSALAARLGIPTNYSICFDWNEDGAVDAGDVSAFAAVLGASCN